MYVLRFPGLPQPNLAAQAAARNVGLKQAPWVERNEKVVFNFFGVRLCGSFGDRSRPGADFRRRAASSEPYEYGIRTLDESPRERLGPVR
jgi:hypothetical protein